MADRKFLTPDEVAERYRGGVSVGTLRNWRAMRRGPSFVKIGKAVLYPSTSLMRGMKGIRWSAVHQGNSASSGVIGRDGGVRSL